MSSVPSSLNTLPARAMLSAMIAGERDPLALANLAKGRMRSKMPELAQALTGNFEAHHAQLARSILHRLDLVEQALRETDQAIAAACAPWTHQIELLQTIPRPRGEGRPGHRRGDRRRHVPVPLRRAPGLLGRSSARGLRV